MKPLYQALSVTFAGRRLAACFGGKRNFSPAVMSDVRPRKMRLGAGIGEQCLYYDKDQICD